ncbi:hypothetical protein D3C85_1451380 [compost metagenome]
MVTTGSFSLSDESTTVLGEASIGAEKLTSSKVVSSASFSQDAPRKNNVQTTSNLFIYFFMIVRF